MNSIMLIGMPGGAEWFVILAALLIPVLCILDIARSEFPNSLTKIAWCAMVVCVPFIGCLLYYWIGTEQKVVSKG